VLFVQGSYRGNCMDAHRYMVLFIVREEGL
jgi:hypothetical protein